MMIFHFEQQFSTLSLMLFGNLLIVAPTGMQHAAFDLPQKSDVRKYIINLHSLKLQGGKNHACLNFHLLLATIWSDYCED